MDITEYPFTVNIFNPNSKNYYAPPCRNCGNKNCKNCPFPLNKTRTLRELLDDMVHREKF